MNRPSRLVLLRHGESARNVAKKGNVYFPSDEDRLMVKGIPDHEIPLTERGLRQALETGPFLRDRYGVFHYIYHSGYARTEQTLNEALAAYMQEELDRMRIRENIFIRERDPGFAYDMTTSEANAAFPWLAAYWKTYGGFMAYPPGGESLAKMCERVYMFLNMLFRDRVGMNVLVVTHGGTIRAFRKLLEHWDYRQTTEAFRADPPKNCSVTCYEYSFEEERLLLKDYNLVAWKEQAS